MKRCAEIQKLLPWLVNRTLTAEEQRTVEAHLSRCSDCRRELAFLEKLRAAIAAAVEAWPGLTTDLYERTLTKLPKESLTIARLYWELFALGFSLGVLYEHGRLPVKIELSSLGLSVSHTSIAFRQDK